MLRPMSDHANLCDHDVFVLMATPDRLPFGLPRVRKATLTTCEVFAAGGEHLCFVDCRLETAGLGFYTDSSKTTALLRVEPRRRLARDPGNPRRTLTGIVRALTREPIYDVVGSDATAIGAIEKVFGERHYRVTDGSGAEPMIVIQENEEASLKEWLTSGRPWSSDRFAFWRGDRRMGWHEPGRSAGISTVDMTADGDRLVDRRLGLAVSCLDVLRLIPTD
jgi:hypothetical protein